MKKIITLFAISLLSFSANAQLRYNSDGTLTFGQVSLIGLQCATGWQGAGHYYTYFNSYGTETWFKINLTQKNVRLSGNGGYIVFYGDNAYEDIYVKSVYTNSDARFKSNIEPLIGNLAITKSLRPKMYDWSATASNSANKVSNKEIGFLAQDLEKVVPQAVATDSDGNKLVNYNAIIPILTGAIQELEAKVVELEQRIKELESK